MEVVLFFLQAIKQDAARSLLSRVDALCKSLEAEKAEKTDEDNGSGMATASEPPLPYMVLPSLPQAHQT